ncbi:hypothetical protein [Streptomyces oceani]|uniref:hypothetical protein n=1 Tax=Streptomyces oceani TaxID=1075402 RepID=UPI0008724ED6|nr:hypothetical protein [Streptomyces oceani]
MKRSLLSRSLLTGLLTVGLLGSGAAVAVATDATPQPRGPHHAGTPARTLPADVPRAQVNSARIDEVVVGQWQEFRVTGQTESVPAGYTVLLQQKRQGEWHTLPTATTVRPDGSYDLRVQLGVTGVNELRTVTGKHGTVTSETMRVLVR